MEGKLRLFKESKSLEAVDNETISSIASSALKKGREKMLLDHLEKYSLENKNILLIGQTSSAFLSFLEIKKATVHRADIKKLPQLPWNDHFFDYLFGMEAIACIAKEKRRLALSEFSRLLSNDGLAFLSTSFDLGSENALLLFMSLIETEFSITNYWQAPDSFFVKIRTLLKSPIYFAYACNHPEWRAKKIAHLRGLKKISFKIQTKFFPGIFWKTLEPYYKYLFNKFDKSEKIYCLFSKIENKFLFSNSISYVLIQGKKRALI